MQEINETTVDLRELLRILLGGLRWIGAASLAGILAAFLATWLLIAPTYTSSVSLYVNNTGGSGGQAAGAVNLNDLNASQRLVNTYIVILEDDEVLEQIVDRLLGEYTQTSLETVLRFTQTAAGNVLEPETLRDVITLSAVNNTEVMRIEATTKNAELSARICTIMTEVAPAVLERVVGAGSVEVIGAAKAAIEPSSPSLPVNLAVGFHAGLALSVAGVLLANQMDNRVTDEDGLKKRFHIPILGTVPDFDENGRKEAGYRYGGREKESR